MIFTGKNGRNYSTVDPAIGKGGEGSIYRINGMPDYVIKVFNGNKRTETRHRKLLAMINSPMPDNAMQQVTWPVDVVYDGGQFAGYVMPAIKNNEDLNVMYSDKYSCTLSEKITIAKNLCSAVNAVHNAGQVCGDLNPKNIGVDPRHAIVTLVDTDSYHITDLGSSRVFRCVVGLPEYLPREIQGKMKNGYTLENAPLPTFTKYSDLFAVAVHIFALLMNGCHPFSCAVNNIVNIGNLANSQPSVTAPQPIENICNGFFPFADVRPGITTPLYAPKFAVLPQEIQSLFWRAFVSGSSNPADRPDTVEWYNALSRMQGNLRQCGLNRQHMYSAHLNNCPWCAVEARMRAAIAPNLTQTSINTNQYYAPQPGMKSAQVNYASAGRGTVVKSHRKRGIGKWIAGAIAAIVLISIIKSCASSGINDIRDYSNWYAQTATSAQDNEGNNDNQDEGQGANDTAESVQAPQYREINVPPLEVNSIAVEGISSNPSSVGSAEILSYSGSISYEDQVDEYLFTASYDGCYRIDMAELYNETIVELYVYDEFGETVGSDTYCVNGEGVTLNNLTAGHAYTVRVRQNSGFSDYSLAIGMQKPTFDLSGYTTVSDSIEYIGQTNVYTFVVPLDGRYRFELSGIQSETVVQFYMLNDLGETVESDMYCTNEEGITAKNLKAGDVYQLHVRQDTGFSGYNMSIGYQKETVDISAISSLADSIEYTSQRNVYSFTVPIDGRYRFELSGMQSGTDVELYMFDDLGETIASALYCRNGEGITVKNLIAGEHYEVQIRQETGLSNYTLSVGMQKETIEVSRASIVNDSIEYTDQRNVYSFTADSSGSMGLIINNMESDMDVELYVFDDLGETVVYDSYCSNGENLNISNVPAGTHYEIQVRQQSGEGTYSLTIN